MAILTSIQALSHSANGIEGIHRTRTPVWLRPLQTSRRCGAGPVQGLPGGKDRTGRFDSVDPGPSSVTNREVAEHVVDPLRRVVAEGVRDCERVEAHAAAGGQVESAPDARAGAAARPGRPAIGLVAGEGGAADHQGPWAVVIEAAAESV